MMLVALAHGAGAQSPAALSKLSVAQRASLAKDEPVQVLEPVSTEWPRSIVYLLIDASPETCAAVLADYELQATYIPRMKSARIVRRDPPDVDVEYVVDIRCFPTSARSAASGWSCLEESIASSGTRCRIPSRRGRSQPGARRSSRWRIRAPDARAR
jgi:hypothetical protein